MKIIGSVCAKHPELKGERRACKSIWTGVLTPSHCLACEKEYEQAYLLKRRELKKIRYENNPEKEREKVRKWRANNLEKSRALTRKSVAKWYAKNPDHNGIQRAAKLRAIPKWANKFFMEEAYDLAKRRTALKSGGHAKWHVDHIVPLRSNLVCGLHVHNNLRVIPSVANLTKGNRHWPDMPGSV